MSGSPTSYGTVRRKNGRWWVKCAPQVMLRLKRVFARVDKGEFGEVGLSDTLENCRELRWFLDRFPMEVAEREYFEARAQEHVDKTARVLEAMAPDYEPPAFALAHPPRLYQRAAAHLLLQSEGLLLADDLGLGKTVSAIAALTDPRTLPAVVVTLTHLPRQWAAELARFAPALRVHIVETGKVYDLERGKRGKRVPPPDVVILNYHKLAGWAEHLAGRYRYVVFDEVQELRHTGSLRYRAAQHLASRVDFRLGLSATPIYNYGGEIHSVLDVLAPGALGTVEEFGREWCSAAAHGEKARIADPRAFGAYARDAGLMLRRTRAEVGRELPALSKIPHWIEADLEAIHAIESDAARLARILLSQAGMERGAKLRAAEELSWMLRRATGLAKAPFVADFVRLLVESGEKVVLYGWHRDVYSLWEDRLRDLKPVFFTGAESPTQKEAARKSFVEGESKLLVMSLRSGAGLDGLQGSCRTVVFGELDWSPGVLEQCVGRVHRDGQAEPVAAYYLHSDTGSDPVMLDVLGLKRGQSTGLRDPEAPLFEQLEGGEGNLKRLAEQFLTQRGLALAEPATTLT